MQGRHEAILALADGRIFRGRAFGAIGEAVGEVVFNTSMTGYQEVLTDPSYKGQIVCMTYPQIGNVGINPEDEESDRIHVEGFVVREYLERPSNWRARLDARRIPRTGGNSRYRRDRYARAGTAYPDRGRAGSSHFERQFQSRGVGRKGQSLTGT